MFVKPLLIFFFVVNRLNTSLIEFGFFFFFSLLTNHLYLIKRYDISFGTKESVINIFLLLNLLHIS